MQNEKPSVAVEPEISVEITDAGIRRVTIYADDADQQARAHRLLARITSQMVQLDAVHSEHLTANLSQINAQIDAYAAWLVKSGGGLTVGTDLMGQAIAFGDYEIAVREQLNPPDASSVVQAMENAILTWAKKHASKKSQASTRNEGRRVVSPHRMPGGVGTFNLAWDNIIKGGYLKLRDKGQREVGTAYNTRDSRLSTDDQFHCVTLSL